MFNKSNKEHMAMYHELMAQMYINDISVIHGFNPANKFGGMTVAYRHSFPNSNMVFVAASYCVKQDAYDEVTGMYHVLDKFFSGEFIQLPLGHLSGDDLAKVLFKKFRCGK